MAVEPGDIAASQLYELKDLLDQDDVPTDTKLKIASLAAQVEIAKRLRGIEASLDQGLRIWIDK